MNLSSVLPKYINDSLLCFTFVHYKVVDGAPEIVTCNSNGYMYEIRNKHVLQCLNLYCDASSVSCCYLTENEQIVIFYLVLTSSNRLLIIRRASKYLKAVKGYDRVKEFEVYDFESVGFPQIKITLMDDWEPKIYNFPIEHTAEVDCDESESTMAESLAEELQILNKHNDELSEEYNQLKKICSFGDSPADFNGVLVGSVRFSSPLKETVQQNLVVCNKWHKVYGTFLILGMKFQNNGNRTLNDIEVIINHKRVKDYSYGFFQPFENIDSFLFAPRDVCRGVKPGEKISAVGAFRIPPFLLDSEFSVPLSVTSSDLKECLAREVFQVSVLDVASESTAGLEERFTVEDLMAILTIKSETRLRIETEDMENGSLESMLIKNLRFTRIRQSKDKLFYCTSTYLNEVFVALEMASANSSRTVWRVLTYTSDSSQVYFLINALYELLPDNTAILHRED